jgi:putative membrane protein
MKKILASISIISFMLMVTVLAAQAAGKLDRKDMKFVHEAAMGGMLQVQLGKVAQEKAQSQDVKDFGARMVTDHTGVNTELKQLADKKGITLPDKLDARHEKIVDKLSKLSGADFDKEYMKLMVKGHEGDVAAFKKASKDLKDPDLKDFATKTLPAFEEHLKLAKETSAKIGMK